MPQPRRARNRWLKVHYLWQSFSWRDTLPPVAFLLFMGAGLLVPLRRMGRPVLPRVFARVVRNLVVAAPGLLLFKVALLALPLATAAWCVRHHFGLLQALHWPHWAEVLCGFLALDLAYYYWHRATHIVPFLWRFHGVHHLDGEMDASTAARFHFGEILLSIPFRCAIVALLGVDAFTLLTYEVCFELATLFHHSNWRLPARLEVGLAHCLVTPRLHGIHHGDQWDQTNSNWSTIFSWWDRLHRTFRLDIPQDALRLGTPDLGTDEGLSVTQILALPFKRR